MPVIKQSLDYLIKPITPVINSSFVSGIFAEKLKISNFKTVLKKDNDLDPANYRPLSIVPIIYKIFEKVMFSRIYLMMTSIAWF